MRRDLCSRGLAFVTLDGSGGAQTFTWSDPGTAGGNAPKQIELEDVPTKVSLRRVTQGAAAGQLAIVATVSGGTITPAGNETARVVVEGEIDWD